MIANATIAAAVLIVLMLAPSRAVAQNIAQPNQKSQTITGCIQRGDAVTAYKLVAKDGVWNLSASEKLKMGHQVDHTVTIRGKVIESFDTKSAGKEGRDPNLRGIFNVTKITTVSGACTL